MRLLNCETFKIETDFETIPPYAILSHRWIWIKRQELTFQEMENGTARECPGYKKIRFAATQALRDGFSYVWLDTVCIDKTNHTEFSEAINSMYQWYAESGTCYAYLADVATKMDIPMSQWFTRGWTLQELLAPPKSKFSPLDGSLLERGRTKICMSS